MTTVVKSRFIEVKLTTALNSVPDQREELLRRSRARSRSLPPTAALKWERRICQPRNESLEELGRQFSRIEERPLPEELRDIVIHSLSKTCSSDIINKIHVIQSPR